MKRAHTANTGEAELRRSVLGSVTKLTRSQGGGPRKSDLTKRIDAWLLGSPARLQKSALRKLLAWHNKPRFHGESIFWHGDVEVARILSSSGRFASFKELVGYYEKKPTLENYLRLRREFPSVEIKSGLFGTSDLDFALEPELIKNGIDPNIVASANNAYEPDVDKVSLRLMECLVTRSGLPTRGPGHIEKRRQAISDTLVDYLIVSMLEALELWSRIYPVAIPASLVVLIRDRLCGPAPDLRGTYISRRALRRAAFIASRIFSRGERISVRKLAKRLHVKQSRAARWLADPEFHREVELCRGPVAIEDFERVRERPGRA